MIKRNKPLYKNKGFKIKEVSQEKKDKAILMKQFFISLRNKREHYSEVSGEFLGNNFSTIYLHHIMSKSKYPELAFKEDNICFLTANEHASVEMNMYKYEYINKRRELLKLKYNIL